MLINKRLTHNAIIAGCVKRNFNFSSEEAISFNMILVGICLLYYHTIFICALNVSYNLTTIAINLLPIRRY